MAADADKDLKPFLDDLISVVVEDMEKPHVKQLLKTVNNKK